MGAYIARRVLVSAFVFLLISVGIFALVRAAPGDPVAMMVPPEMIGPGHEDFLAAKRQELGLDKPVPVQYGVWLGNAVQGDLGFSYVSSRPVGELLLERLVPTLELMGVALIIKIVVAIPLGLLVATRKNTAVDYVVSVVSLAAISIPGFFIAIIGIYVFALKLNWLPSAGMSTPGDGSLGDMLSHLVMPALILGFAPVGVLTRYVRASALTEITSDYVRTAKAKGASPSRQLYRHVLRNALIPVITVVMLSLPTLLAGAVVIETIFAWPGMGSLAVSSVGQQDYPVIIGFALMVSIMVLVANFAADLLYTAADPRVRLS